MIVFREVTKQFGEMPPAIQDISFIIEPGELVVITGPSGSGKTTLMRLLTREYTPSQGEIEFEGTPLHRLSAGSVHHHRRQIGVVFQDYKLLPELNVWENIALALQILGKSGSEIEERVSDLLTLVGLADKAMLFPTQLSGGEAQRVSIARALAPGPKVIFADEPTGNLDPETTKHIAKLLKKINELGTTMLIATHDMGVLDMVTGERHLRLNQGKLEIDSKPKHFPVPEKDTEESKTEAEPAKKKVKTPHHPKPEPVEPAPAETTQEPPAKSSSKPGLGGFFSKLTTKRPPAEAEASTNDEQGASDSSEQPNKAKTQKEPDAE